MSAPTPQQQTAYRLTRAAIKRGELVRPSECEKCGATPKTADGRSAIQAHHPDYSKPLLVEWICAKCHRAETPLPKVMGAPNPGESNGQAKLTAAQVAEIRASSLGCRRLGYRYGVDKKTIQRIRTGEQWRSVPIHAGRR